MTHALWPWEVHHFRHKDGGWVAIFHRPGKRTAEIFRIHFPPGIGQRALEISRLIEAAPGLLTVCIETMTDIMGVLHPSIGSDRIDLEKTHDRLVTVIIKAEGKDGAE